MLLAIAAAITTGAILGHGAYSVGPYGAALPGSLRWACLRGGKVVPVVEEWRVTESRYDVDRAGWGAGCSTREAHDWSAFGAALAFVRAVGEPAAARVLKGAS